MLHIAPYYHISPLHPPVGKSMNTCKKSVPVKQWVYSSLKATQHTPLGARSTCWLWAKISFAISLPFPRKHCTCIHMHVHTRGSWVYVYVRRLTEHTITCSLTGVALFKNSRVSYRIFWWGWKKCVRHCHSVMHEYETIYKLSFKYETTQIFRAYWCANTCRHHHNNKEHTLRLYNISPRFQISYICTCMYAYSLYASNVWVRVECIHTS